jgi:hypothetical protein
MFGLGAQIFGASTSVCYFPALDLCQTGADHSEGGRGVRG